MTSRIRLFCLVLLVSLAFLRGASAQVYFTSQSDWLTAAGGAAAVTVFHFDGPTETQGKYANDPTITPSYSSQGVDFLPFLNTSIYPILARNQGYQISDPTRDGL